MQLYKTVTGNYGASVDGGETIFNHLGRRMPLTGAWTPTDADPDALTPACRAAAEAVEAEEDAEVDRAAAARDAERAQARAQREAREARLEADRAQWARWAASPEGKAQQARELARWQDIARRLLARGAGR